VLLAFAAIGRANHGEAVATLDTLGTALPLIVGWFASGAALGGFGADAQGAQAGPAAAAAAKTWAVGVPLGIALRSASRGYVPAASFIGVTLGITCALMVGWRVALAAVTPEVRVLHGAGCAGVGLWAGAAADAAAGACQCSSDCVRCRAALLFFVHNTRSRRS
jgi:hypothetical protein